MRHEKAPSKWRWGRVLIGERFRCPGYKSQHSQCGELFDTERGLTQHMKLSGHEEPFFMYAKHVGKTSVTCTACGYVPAHNVDDPRKCFTDHRRRQHRLEYMRERRPYTIAEEP